MIVLIFKGKNDVMSSGSYSGKKLLKHVRKIVEWVGLLERQIQTLINLNKMKFAFMPGKRAVDA